MFIKSAFYTTERKIPIFQTPSNFPELCFVCVTKVVNVITLSTNDLEVVGHYNNFITSDEHI